MPRRSLLSNEQRTRLFAIPVDHAEMARLYNISQPTVSRIVAAHRLLHP